MLNQVSDLGTRDRIVATAMGLFAEKGYQSTSIADILRAAGIHSGSLYHFFETKQELLLAVLRAYRDGIDAMLVEPAWSGVDDPVERVFALLARYRGLLAESGCQYGCPIGSLALELHEPDPPVRELLAANFDAWRERVAGCFEAAADRLPEGSDPKALAAFVLTVMEGAVMQARTYRRLEVFDTCVDMLRQYLNVRVAHEARGEKRGGRKR